MCREILEHREEGEQQHALTFTEDAMRTHATASAAAREAAAQNKKPRRPPNANGAAWRTQAPGQ
jgi:hypothetical protein